MATGNLFLERASSVDVLAEGKSVSAVIARWWVYVAGKTM